MKKTRLLILSVGLVFLGVTVLLYGISEGWQGYTWQAAKPTPIARPISANNITQRPGEVVASDQTKQILFGDLHVHSTFSIDAFFMSLPSAGGDGLHPISDACDFARYCSQLDFFSMNDHAVSLGPVRWQNTIDELQQCNNVADPNNPDLIPFLGFEWTQAGATKETHYGHKNVMFKSLEADKIPSRPIAALASPEAHAPILNISPFPIIGAVGLLGGENGLRITANIADFRALSECDKNVPVRDLPVDCLETAATPAELFAKLDDWNLDTLVIPHGTTWGMYTPPGSDWQKQLKGKQHNVKYQKLIEVFSGHGNSEQYRDFSAIETAADGTPICPAPSDNYLPACWRAGEITYDRCMAAKLDNCETIAEQAKLDFLLSTANTGHQAIPKTQPDDWLDAGQCKDCWLPTFNYRSKGSAQYILALRNFDDAEQPKKFKLGFIASSDNHSARPGTGYKEFARDAQTEARFDTLPGLQIGASFMGPKLTQDKVKSLPILALPASPFLSWNFERAASWFLTGGLVAVHSEGKTRDSVWDGLQRQETYATSGPRILLWFDLMEGKQRHAMGSELSLNTTPRFKVTAKGSFEQKDGCPDFSSAALGGERIDTLCNGECFYPSDTRRKIRSIEIVRILPQTYADEDISQLVQDPWRVYNCDDQGDGCSVEFEDDEYTSGARDAVYYVRALEEASPVVGAKPLKCETDENGRCLRVITSCAKEDGDCKDLTQQRAWSSPIYVNFAGK